MENVKIKPNPKGFKEHLTILTSNDSIDTETKSVDEILNNLLKEVKPVDFKAVKYPRAKKMKEKIIDLDNKIRQSKDELKKQILEGELEALQKDYNQLKLYVKDQYVIVVNKVIELAKANKWGLCRSNDDFYIFNNHYWETLTEGELKDFLSDCAKKMGVDLIDSQDHVFVDKLGKQFYFRGRISRPKPNKNKVLINLQNGTYEIHKGKGRLREFRSEDFLTYQLPFQHNINANAPIFQNYLDEVLPNQSVQKVLAEYIGYTFIKHGSKLLKKEKILLLNGTGANGKSVLFEIITAMLGKDNVTNYPLSSLTKDEGYYRAKIENKLVNYSSELSKKLDVDWLKKIASGEPITARNPYGEPYEIDNYAKLIFNTNELPKDIEFTNAYFRRFMIIPFDVTIPKDKQDPELHNKIIENELSGVFNWALDGLDRLIKNENFTKCDIVDNAIENFKIESDSVKMFELDNNCKISTDRMVRLSEVYNLYKAYCQENGHMPVSNKTLSKRLQSIGYTVKRKSQGNMVNMEGDNLLAL